MSILARTCIPALLLATLLPLPVAAQDVATQALPFAPGFPRTDIREVNFSSPTVVDLDGDGQLEILVGDMGGCVSAFTPSGAPKAGFPWRTLSGCSVNARINGPLAVGDVDGDDKLEVVAGTTGTGLSAGTLGKTYVWNHDGTLAAGWPKEMTWNPRGNGKAEVLGIALANVAGDDALEVIAGTSNNSLDVSETTLSMYVYRGNGSTLPGWPLGFRAAGIYGNVGAADLDGDGYANPITGRDQLYFHAYRADGTWLPGWPLRAYVDANKTNYFTDSYVEFTEYVPAMGDLDGDGTIESVIAGKRRQAPAHVTVDCGVFVVEPNGSRRAGWEQPKGCDSPWLAAEFRPQNGVALGDLDGDGTLEIVITLFDGTVRAYSAGGQQLWKYNYAQGKTLFASEPVIGDVTGDGKVDILFGTYSPDGSAHDAARLLALDAQGRPLSGYPLTLPGEGTAPKRGVRAAPTLADLDGNGTVEIVAASLGGALYVWQTDQPYNASLLPWPTGRQNNQRTGFVSRPTTRQPQRPVPSYPAQAFIPFMSRSFANR